MTTDRLTCRYMWNNYRNPVAHAPRVKRRHLGRVAQKFSGDKQLLYNIMIEYYRKEHF